MRFITILCSLLIAGNYAPKAVAQTRAPFSEVEIIVSGTVARSGEPFSQYWALNPGVSVRLETPFYLGHVFGSGMVASVSARDGMDVPSYQSGLLTAGWAASIRLPGEVRITPGIRTGLYWTLFDAPTATMAVRNESEMAAGIDLRITVPIGAGWNLSGSASAIRIFTYHPLDLQFFEIGVSRLFLIPEWLREVLE